MRDLWNVKRPTFWWFWLLVAHFIMALVFYNSLIDSVFDTFLHEIYWIDVFWIQTMWSGLPIVIFLTVVWLFPRLTKFELSLPLALIQWGLVALGTFLVVVPQHTIPMNRCYVDYPGELQKYNDMSLLGGWFFWIGVAAFLPVLLEALVKKRPVD